jgi:alpha-D-ribose 1-methylphosphonate 5-triphosphate synthase subunit PhnG
MSFTRSDVPDGPVARREWMAVLARTPCQELQAALDAALEGSALPEFDWLRAPDVGLAMVRGRIGGTGDAFNLGEITVTRATLRLRMHDGSTPVGVAVHSGRDKERAKLAALVDALMQVPSYEAHLRERLIGPLAQRIAERRAGKKAQAADTKVEFFTMVRGD